MILPDANVLVVSFRREAADHERYAAWLAAVVAGTEELALTDSTATGFLRIVTSPRIFRDPAPTDLAIEFVDVLRHGQRTRWLRATPATWQSFTALAASDRQLRGNLVPDAWIAAVAISHGARVATADRGFARFAGVDWFDPAS